MSLSVKACSPTHKGHSPFHSQPSGLRAYSRHWGRSPKGTALQSATNIAVCAASTGSVSEFILHQRCISEKWLRRPSRQFGLFAFYEAAGVRRPPVLAAYSSSASAMNALVAALRYAPWTRSLWPFLTKARAGSRTNPTTSRHLARASALANSGSRSPKARRRHAIR